MEGHRICCLFFLTIKICHRFRPNNHVMWVNCVTNCFKWSIDCWLTTSIKSIRPCGSLELELATLLLSSVPWHVIGYCCHSLHYHCHCHCLLLRDTSAAASRDIKPVLVLILPQVSIFGSHWAICLTPDSTYLVSGVLVYVHQTLSQLWQSVSYWARHLPW